MSRVARSIRKCCFLLLLVPLTGCGGYDSVGPAAYEYSKALYSVCNRQDEPRLQRVAQQIEAAHAQAELTDTELEWLSDIVTTAQTGDWQEATQNSRHLMEAQVVQQ